MQLKTKTAERTFYSAKVIPVETGTTRELLPNRTTSAALSTNRGKNRFEPAGETMESPNRLNVTFCFLFFEPRTYRARFSSGGVASRARFRVKVHFRLPAARRARAREKASVSLAPSDRRKRNAPLPKETHGSLPGGFRNNSNESFSEHSDRNAENIQIAPRNSLGRCETVHSHLHVLLSNSIFQTRILSDFLISNFK